MQLADNKYDQRSSLADIIFQVTRTEDVGGESKQDSVTDVSSRTMTTSFHASPTVYRPDSLDTRSHTDSFTENALHLDT